MLDSYLGLIGVLIAVFLAEIFIAFHKYNNKKGVMLTGWDIHHKLLEELPDEE